MDLVCILYVTQIIYTCLVLLQHETEGKQTRSSSKEKSEKFADAIAGKKANFMLIYGFRYGQT